MISYHISHLSLISTRLLFITHLDPDFQAVVLTEGWSVNSPVQDEWGPGSESVLWHSTQSAEPWTGSGRRTPTPASDKSALWNCSCPRRRLPSPSDPPAWLFPSLKKHSSVSLILTGRPIIIHYSHTHTHTHNEVTDETEQRGFGKKKTHIHDRPSAFACPRPAGRSAGFSTPGSSDWPKCFHPTAWCCTTPSHPARTWAPGAWWTGNLWNGIENVFISKDKIQRQCHVVWCQMELDYT